MSNPNLTAEKLTLEFVRGIQQAYAHQGKVILHIRLHPYVFHYLFESVAKMLGNGIERTHETEELRVLGILLILDPFMDCNEENSVVAYKTTGSDMERSLGRFYAVIPKA